MGCNCRSSRKRSTSKPRSATVSTRRSASVCSQVESAGDNLSIKVGPTGNLTVEYPFKSGISASVLLNTHKCSSPFAKALASAEAKLTRLFFDPSKKEAFLATLGTAKVLKFGYLRDILRSL